MENKYFNYDSGRISSGLNLQYNKGFTLVELLVVIAIIALLMGILMPSLNMARKQAQKTICFNNMRQMGITMTLYLMNNENHLPASSCHEDDPKKYWLRLLAKYSKEPMLFKCPCDKSESDFVDWTQPLQQQIDSHPDGIRYSSYAANNLLDPIVIDVPGNNGRFNNVMTIKNPDQCIWILEAPSHWKTEDHPHPEYWFANTDMAKKYIAWERHLGKANYTFVDGHVECLKIEDTYNINERCLWFPQSAPRWPGWVKNSPF